MIFDTLTIYEKELILKGFEEMTVTNQNSLVNAIATKLNCAVWQVSPAQILTHHKNLKLSMINESCELAISNGFTSTNGHKYRLNQDDQVNMLGQKDRLNDRPEVDKVFWKTEDAGYIEHTRASWLVMQAEAFDHKLLQLMRYNEKATAIVTATTHKQIVEANWQSIN